MIPAVPTDLGAILVDRSDSECLSETYESECYFGCPMETTETIGDRRIHWIPLNHYIVRTYDQCMWMIGL